MNCTVQMINCFTGEIYYTKELGYAFHLSNKQDVGMSKVREVIESFAQYNSYICIFSVIFLLLGTSTASVRCLQ